MLKHWRWKIAHLDLSQGFLDLAATPGWDGIFTVFWWRGIPLGYREILAEQLPMPASELANLAVQTITPTIGAHLLDQGFKAALPGVSVVPRQPADGPPQLTPLLALQQPLIQLEQHWAAANQASAETVSVVICTRDRPQQLEQCLRSLLALADPPDEILVVDNAPSSDATQQVVAAIESVRYVREPRPGLSVARNTGIAQATGTIVAFTDDDVEVHPHWISRLRMGFQDPEVMVVTGLMLPAKLETEAEVAFHRGTSEFSWECRPLVFDAAYFEAMKPFGAPVWHIGAGANMALRRQIVEQVGGFDERLGAGASGCSEDSEFWYRVLAAGYKCRYEPTAVIFHYHRSDLAGLRQQMYAYMQGHVTALLIQAFQHRHWGNLFRLLVVLPEYYARLIARGLISGFYGRYRTIDSEMRGCLAGLLFFLNHRSPSPDQLTFQSSRTPTDSYDRDNHFSPT